MDDYLLFISIPHFAVFQLLPQEPKTNIVKKRMDHNIKYKTLILLITFIKL